MVRKVWILYIPATKYRLCQTKIEHWFSYNLNVRFSCSVKSTLKSFLFIKMLQMKWNIENFKHFISCPWDNVDDWTLTAEEWEFIHTFSHKCIPELFQYVVIYEKMDRSYWKSPWKSFSFVFGIPHDDKPNF